MAGEVRDEAGDCTFACRWRVLVIHFDGASLVSNECSIAPFIPSMSEMITQPMCDERGRKYFVRDVFALNACSCYIPSRAEQTCRREVLHFVERELRPIMMNSVQAVMAQSLAQDL